MNPFITKHKKGFILPFAVLLSGIVLSIGLAVFNLLIKEVLLASSGRESQFAFYAADSAGECALFWDAKQGIFPTSSASIIYSLPFTCGGMSFSLAAPTTIVGTANAATTTFSSFAIPNPAYCVRVTVAKYGGFTKIESEGFNTCNVSDLRRVERAVRIVY